MSQSYQPLAQETWKPNLENLKCSLGDQNKWMVIELQCWKIKT